MPPVTPEPTLSPLEAVPLAPVLLTGAQITGANTTRKRLLNTARLSRYRRGLDSPELPISKAMELNLTARISITTTTTSSRHGRLLKRNLAAISYATRKLSTFKATTLKDARISVVRTSVLQELNSHVLHISEDRLTPFSTKKLLHHLRQTAPSSLDLSQPGLSAKILMRGRRQAPNLFRLYRAAERHVKAAALNLNHLLETQKRLTATKGGPFMVPRSPHPQYYLCPSFHHLGRR